MNPQLIQQPIDQLSTERLVAIGTIFNDDQARKKYRYVAFGGSSTINSGLLLVAPAAPANSTGLALNAANTNYNLSLGSTQLLITNGATVVTQDQFRGGQIEILGAGALSAYTIAGNSGDSVGGGVITVQLEMPLRNSSILLVGTNTVNLRVNPARNCVASLTLSQPVGVTIMPVPNTASVQYFGWVQIAGPGFVAATTAVKGQAFTQDTAGTAGYIMSTAATTSYQCGAVQESVSSSFATVKLAIE